MIEVECSRCGSRWQVEDESAGAHVQCRKCGLIFKPPVPGGDEAAEGEPQTPALPAEAAQPPSPPPLPWEARKEAEPSGLAAGGLLLGLAAFVVAVASIGTCAGLVVALILSLFGLTCSIVAVVKAARARAPIGLAITALVLNSLFIVLLPFYPVLMWLWMGFAG